MSMGAGRRREDWPERLAAVIAAARGRPFAWGRHDCCLFAAECVAAITGVDPAAGWRGRYASENEALALVRTEGHEGVREAVAAVADQQGWPAIAVAAARRGDVAWLARRHRAVVAVVVGARLLAVGTGGLVWFSRAAALGAWRIG